MKNQMITAAAVLAMGASLAIASPQSSTTTAPQSPAPKAAPAATGTADSSTTAAPGTGSPAQRGMRQRMMGRDMEKLNMTDAQKQQVQALRDKFQADNSDFIQKFMQNLRDLRQARQSADTQKATDLQAALEKQRPQMDALRADLDAKFTAILTPDQQKQYLAIKAQRQATMRAQTVQPTPQPQPAPQPQH